MVTLGNTVLLRHGHPERLHTVSGGPLPWACPQLTSLQLLRTAQHPQGQGQGLDFRMRPLLSSTVVP